MKGVILQVALDLLNEHRAIAIAKDSVTGGADWVEAGTPLIKSEGMEIIRKLKEIFITIQLEQSLTKNQIIERNQNKPHKR